MGGGEKLKLELCSRGGLSSGEQTLLRYAGLSSSLLARCQPGLGHGPGVPGGRGYMWYGAKGKKGFWCSNPFETCGMQDFRDDRG